MASSLELEPGISRGNVFAEVVVRRLKVTLISSGSWLERSSSLAIF